MKRAVVVLAVLGVAAAVGAESYPKATVRKVGPNQNSYTLHDWNARASTRARTSTSNRERNYAEVDVTPAPALQAAPVAPQTALPAPSPVQMETYSQTHNPGPSQMAANRSGTASQSIYSLGPNWGPYWNGGFYNGGFYDAGFYNGGFFNGAGFYNRPGFCPNPGFNYGPGFQSNLPQQRFDPLPGQHPFSIQRPQMFPGMNSGFCR